jgi:hypothetical protein
MAYQTNTGNLKRLVGIALTTEDFAQRADEADVSQDDLVRHLSRDPDLWASAHNFWNVRTKHRPAPLAAAI